MFGSASVALAQGPLPNCNAPDPATCGNLVVNPSFERTVDGTCPSGSSTFGDYRATSSGTMTGNPIPSIVCGWFSASYSNFPGTPDLFNVCAPAPGPNYVFGWQATNGVPYNFATLHGPPAPAVGGQTPRTGQGYAGLIAYTQQRLSPAIYPPTNANEYREYMAQNVTLAPATAYYASFRTNIAPLSALALPSLGMAFTTLSPPGGGSGPVYTGHGPIPLTPVVSGPVPSTPQSSWNAATLVQGIFTSSATGSEKQMIIGNFGPGYGGEPPYTVPFSPGPRRSIPASDIPNDVLIDKAYYFIEDVILQAVPTAGPNLTTNCGQLTTLGAGCPLPADAGPAAPAYTYSWSPTTDLQYGSEHSAQALLRAGLTTPSQYTLTVTLRNGQQYISTVNVTVNRPTLTITLSYEKPYCAGSTLTLTASGDISGATYHWDAAPGLTATTGSTVTVTLVPGTTAYRVHTACGNTYIKLDVKDNCCLFDIYRSQGVSVKELNNPVGVATAYTGSPFGTVPNCIFHVTAPLTLGNSRYELPPGTQVLFDQGTYAEVVEQAELILQGATLTAACSEMWEGVYVRPSAKGIQTFDPKYYGQRSTVEHSLNGLVLDEPDPSVPYYFRIGNTDFRQNYQSVAVNREKTPASPDDWIQACDFDSDPAAFKIPYKGKKYYSQQHIRLVGDARAGLWTGNRLQHAMFGLLVDHPYGWFNLEDNRFEDCYVAGIAQGDFSVANTWAGPGAFEARLDNNWFYFPTTQPTAGQQALQSMPSGTNMECHGAMLEMVQVDATRNHFLQSAAPGLRYSDFETAFGGVRQVGLRSQRLRTADANEFVSLSRGLVTNLPEGARVTLTANTFRDCAQGVLASTRFGIGPGAPPSTAPPILFTTCNTFKRDPKRLGLARGLHIEDINPGTANPLLILDDFASRGAILKDLFLPEPYGRPNTEFMAIDNTSGLAVDYNTFSAQALAGIPTSYQPYVTNITLLDAGLIDLSMTPAPGQGPCSVDGFPNTGIQFRSGGSSTSPNAPKSSRKASIGQNSPNPCSGSTTLTYQLPADAREAHLVIRRGLDGAEMEQVTLKRTVDRQLLNLQAYKPGLYFYTLMVDGAPVQTKRMLVE